MFTFADQHENEIQPRLMGTSSVLNVFSRKPEYVAVMTLVGVGGLLRGTIHETVVEAFQSKPQILTFFIRNKSGDH